MIRVGIMGLGQIAHRVAKGICYAENAELYAVGSRSLEKAGEFQRLYGAQKIYDSYERLLQDPQVEMVYIYAHQIICISSIFKTLCAMESMFYVKSRWWRMLSS